MCAGADFRSDRGEAESGPDGGRLAFERTLAVCAPFLSVLDIEVPVVGAKYGANFVRLGIHSGMAISYLLPGIVGVPAAVDLLFCGRLVSGEETVRIGLAHSATEPERVLSEAQRRARRRSPAVRRSRFG